MTKGVQEFGSSGVQGEEPGAREGARPRAPRGHATTQRAHFVPRLSHVLGSVNKGSRGRDSSRALAPHLLTPGFWLLAPLPELPELLNSRTPELLFSSFPEVPV